MASGAAAEAQLLGALLAGDEAAFATLVDRHHASMRRVALAYVPDEAVADEVAQETWLQVLRSLARFEGRSSLKTWIFRILVNTAKRRGERERRTVPFSSLAGPWDPGGDEPEVDPSRFLPADHPRWPDHWAAPPQAWPGHPEERALAGETLACVRRAMGALPANQRAVMALRDVEGWTPDEVCDALGLSEGNQRVLLHRARSKVRRALEAYFGGATTP